MEKYSKADVFGLKRKGTLKKHRHAQSYLPRVVMWELNGLIYMSDVSKQFLFSYNRTNRGYKLCKSYLQTML